MSQGQIEDKLEASKLRIVLLTGGVGAAVGVVVSLLSLTTDFFPVINYWLAATIPFFSGGISGLAGLAGIYLAQGLAELIETVWLRKVTTFFLVVTTVNIVFIIVILRMGVLQTIQPLLWGLGSGYIFGAVVMIADHYFWQMRKKVLTLELENKYLAEIAKKESLLQKKTRNLIVTQERNRLARELHDSVSQGLQGIIYTVHSLREQLEGTELETGEIIKHLDLTARTTLDELRTMIDELKPSLLEEEGLIEAIRLQGELVANRQQLEVNQTLEEGGKLSPKQELAVYRIIQESLANIQEHAAANKVDIFLKQEADKVKLIIEDDGRGFEVGAVDSGNGLENMTLRCQENNGWLEIKSNLEAGTKVKAVFKVES